jgi:hypothetical protein
MIYPIPIDPEAAGRSIYPLMIIKVVFETGKKLVMAQ